ncbi:hypothetical protein K461DRAFT_294910 [Myriangium duriaei CBS 260.36]|uniref:peptidylprolyl isomerase n=1 Tax=Myriangium duriaei CBS 260.36 TaxID=1168546 RepID=A0A9P4MJH2_9PEZI|nr:hypothetical protein K461DRAFT_294910 [Myriangium duriaei CBS 260.36]
MEGEDRPRVFLDVSIGAEPAGRLVIELFTDKAPKTCENFLALCTGTHKGLTYATSPFHRVIDDFMIQGGDITAGDGTGGLSIYGPTFDDENLSWRPLDSPGLVCMANRGPDTNTSQFFITLTPCPHLNAKHTVFGHLISGDSVLSSIAAQPVDASDRPKTPILISRCGQLERRRPATKQSTQALSPGAARGRQRSTSRTASPPPRRVRAKADETRRGRPRSRSRSREKGRKRGVEEERETEESSPARKHARVRSASPSRRREEEGLRRSRSRSAGGHEGRRERRDGMGERRRDWRDGRQERGRERRYGDRDQGGRYDGGGYGGRWERRGYDGRRNKTGDEGRLNDGRLGGGGGRDEAEESGIKFKGRGAMKYREPERR